MEYRIYTSISKQLGISGGRTVRSHSKIDVILIAFVSYPTDNCGARYNDGPALDPQTVLPQFLAHTAVTTLLQGYLNSTGIAQTYNKPFLMFETNTASCGGFPGVSDAFAASLWALDYALQMAYSNFSMGLFHTGGQNDSYNVSNTS